MADFLSGYNAQNAFNQQRTGADVANATGALTLADHLEALRNKQALNAAIASGDPAVLARVPGGLAALLQQAHVKKAQADAAMGEQFAGMDLARATPDQVRAIGVRAGIGGHPGAATMINQAEHMQRALDAKSALTSMQSTPGTPAQEPITAVDDSGLPNPTVPAGAPKAGATDFLQSSPFPVVANAAKALQARIDAGTMTADRADVYIKNLTTMHQTEQGRIDADARKMGNNIDLKVMFPPGTGRGGSSGSAGPTVGDFTKSGSDFLNTIPEADRTLIKKLANYDIDPKTLSTKGGHRERMLSLVTQYDPTYDDTQYANKRRAITQFGTGPQGNTVRSLNVAIEHIDTLQRAADALKNTDLPAFNKVANEIATFTGKSPPNTFEGLRDMVANEVVKGTIGNAGALQDRAQAAEKVKAAASPKQLSELFNGWTELMGGQVKGLERQYEASTRNKDFRDRYLTPRTQAAIGAAENAAVPQNRRANDVPAGIDAKIWKHMTDTERALFK